MYKSMAWHSIARAFGGLAALLSGMMHYVIPSSCRETRERPVHLRIGRCSRRKKERNSQATFAGWLRVAMTTQRTAEVLRESGHRMQVRAFQKEGAS